MIDSVLKGTGNSRFLKSAVPAGTSWADALAMLQAGTFPVDFNGINTEGFQQIGTPLNKANLLKDATAAQIGLPPSTTPDGMFRALGNTGELHVWRKTVVNSQPQDAYYSLGSIITTSGTIIDLSKQNVNQVGFRLSDSVMVLPDGSVSLVNPKMYYKYTYNDNMYQHRFVASDGTYIIDGNFSGKFISFYADSPSYYGSNYITLDKIYYIPATASFTYGAKLRISQLQPVIGHAAITAGTTTTYPVSTNPNAYQEGSDAKPARYTLGDVVTGKYILGWVAPGNTDIKIDVSSALTVSDSGDVSMSNPSIGQSFNTATSDLLGKFIRANTYGITSSNTQGYQLPSGIIHIPSTATIKNEVIPSISSSSQWVTIDRYQPVTGYAAIPAGTTIEYLGKLGDKARVQVVSYVGTGTYGSSNPNSLTFDRSPRLVIVKASSSGNIAFFAPGNNASQSLPGTSSSNRLSVTWSNNNKTMSWRGESAPAQLNQSGNKYTVIVIYG